MQSLNKPILIFAIAAGTMAGGAIVMVWTAVMFVLWNRDGVCDAVKDTVREQCCDAIPEVYGAWYDENVEKCNTQNTLSYAIRDFETCIDERMEWFMCDG